MKPRYEEIEERTKLLHELKAIRYTLNVVLVNLLSLGENTIRFEDGLLRKVAQLVQRERKERESELPRKN